MQYQDNDFKFVAVLNEKVELGLLMNALGHMTAGLVAQISDLSVMRFLKYENPHSAPATISHYPYIILGAKNGNQIRSLKSDAQECGIQYNFFADTMIGSSAADQLAKTQNTSESEFDYYGIVLFGPSETLRSLTRKFSLFKRS